MAENDAHQGKRKFEEESSANSDMKEEEYDSDHDMYVGNSVMDRETREKYWKQGFDITLDLELDCSLGAPIVPQRHCLNKTEFNEISCLAIDAFNSHNNTKFQFVENLSVTTTIAAGYWCRNTFRAKDSDSDASFIFQAMGFWGISGDRIIAFCRLKKTPTQGDEYPPYSNPDYEVPH
ncbi:uncharacterized protein LOC107028661 isoform X2 [Solanum pennellii]|uniref:Uncharacterized protein LOC107028661 isoform X2 n=1 Tax=Solanum pennellii TaxID=28526 RepID=A0ABM1HGR2_SOLPN|nr:uncharacterized protein LOC107028661 isoform X2 [Solanum pennellii]